MAGSPENDVFRQLASRHSKVDSVPVRRPQEVLRSCASHEQLRNLKGWGETSERNLARAIRQMQEVGGRMPLALALDIAEDLVVRLAALPQVSRTETTRQFIERAMRENHGYTVPARWLADLDPSTRRPPQCGPARASPHTRSNSMSRPALTCSSAEFSCEASYSSSSMM